MPPYKSVAVIGAGAWGTALSSVAARAGRHVMLYARSAWSASRMKATRENLRLPGVRIEPGVEITGDMAQAARADIILIATPAQHLREAVTALSPHLKQADARHRLRQGHRARHAQIHDRDHRRDRAECDSRNPLRTELCR